MTAGGRNTDIHQRCSGSGRIWVLVAHDGGRAFEIITGVMIDLIITRYHDASDGVVVLL